MTLNLSAPPLKCRMDHVKSQRQTSSTEAKVVERFDLSGSSMALVSLDGAFTPRLEAYLGKQVPNPLRVKTRGGDGQIETVLEDLMALTKHNYYSAGFFDGLPVTLRFADLVGEILTAGPDGGSTWLPFRHCI